MFIFKDVKDTPVESAKLESNIEISEEVIEEVPAETKKVATAQQSESNASVDSPTPITNFENVRMICILFHPHGQILIIFLNALYHRSILFLIFNEL